MVGTANVQSPLPIPCPATPACSIRLQDIPQLCQSHCKVKDTLKVERIINEFVCGGPQRVQFVTDFDFTITKQRNDDGTPVLSSFGIFNACKTLPDSYVDATKVLHLKYRPIEIDPRLSKEEKVQYMVEWWEKSSELLVGFPFDETEIDTIAVTVKDSLRDRSQELFQKLYCLDIPVLVFSAGMGNSVMSVLRQANVLHPNVKVISNFLQYKDGLLNGLKEPVIHTFNKNETALEGHEYYDLVHTRDHIILMGDTLADSGMADGVPASSHVLKIGFLFDHVDENLEKYMNTFDIVLVDDQTMDVPLALFTLIAQQRQDMLKPAAEIE